MASKTSGRIQGLTIQIGGDTTKLEKALKSSNKEIKNTQNALKDVEKLLKLDPTNIELLNQKQKLLNKSVTETREKLDKLYDAERQLKDAGIDENSEQFMGLRREIIDTENSLEEAEKAAKNFNANLEKASASLKEVSDKAGQVAQKTEKLSKAAQGLLAGAAAAGTAIVKSYAEYEQLIGGIETLFKDSALTLEKYAQRAYKTAGMSANDYMETATSFAASLIQGLEGDTKQAVKLTDMAITDMSDNANKMGTSIDSIQNAYQGFAKQTFTMLDNLRLGYGGTQEEMQRLLDDATALSGIEYDITNLADIINAIHVIQTDLGITGTTAKEAESTISGSISSLKAALENLLTYTGTAGADVEHLTQQVIDAFKQVADNILPIIQNILDNLPEWVKVVGVITAIVAVISPIAGLISSITLALANLGPAIAALTPIITAATAAAPWIALAAAIATIVTLVVTNWDKIKATLSSAVEYIKTNFIDKVVEYFQGVKERWDNFWEMITERAKTNINSIIGFINKGIDAINSLISKINNSGLAQAFNINIGSLGTIPMLANGGTLSRGSAIVGESGAEMLSVNNGKATVTPLTNNTTINNINNASSRPIELTIELDRSVLARQLYSALDKEGIRRGSSLVGAR